MRTKLCFFFIILVMIITFITMSPHSDTADIDNTRIIHDAKPSPVSIPEMSEEEFIEEYGVYDTDNPIYIMDTSPIQEVISADEFYTYNMIIPSNLTPEQLASGLLYELKPLAPYFIEMEEEYGINAVYLSAIAAQESGWGRYCFKKNNIFGFGNMSFATKYECITYVSEFLADNYLHSRGEYYTGGFTLSHVNYHYNGSDEWYDGVTSISNQIMGRVSDNYSTIDF